MILKVKEVITTAEDLTLRIPIEGDVSPISRALDTMKSKVANAMGQVKDAMGAVGLMAAGFLVSAVKSAAASEVNFANLTQVIKSTGKAAGFSADQIKAMSKELSDQTTFTGGEIMKGQNMLLTFTGIQGDVLKRASMAMLDMSQKYGTKPEAQAIALGKALNDPIKGISALSRVGVVFTEQQKAQVKAMEDAGNMAGAQKIILDELSKEFGGQATAASQTYEGQIKQTTNSLNAAKTAIGTALMPTLASMASKLNVVAGNIQDFTDKHKKLIAGILVAVAVIGTMVGGLGILTKVTSILGPAISGISALIGGMGLPIILVIAGIAALTLAYTKNFGGLKTFIDGTIGKVIALIKGFAAAWNNDGKGVFDSIGTLFGKNSTAVRIALWGITDGIKIFISILTGNFKKAGDILGEWSGDADEKTGNVVRAVARVALKVQQVVTQIVALVKAQIPKIEQVIQLAFTKIKLIWETILKPVFNLMIEIIKTVVKTVIDNWPKIKLVIDTIIQGIKNTFNNILVPVMKVAIAIIKTVVDWVVLHWPQIQQVIKVAIDVIFLVIKTVLVPAINFAIKVFSGIVSWVTANWPLIQKTITTTLNSVWAIIKIVLGAIKLFWSLWGKSIMDVISTCFNVIKITISTGINVAKNVIKAVMQLITGDWKGAWNSIVNAVKDIFGGIGAIIGTLLKGVSKVFTDYAKSAIDLGKGIIGGVIDGIKQKANDIKKGVDDIVKLVIEKFKEGFGIHSPATSTTWIGGHLIGGLIKGMKGGNVKSFVDSMVKSIKASFGSLSGTGGDVKGWLMEAMAVTGTDMSNLPALLAIANKESGGNPKAINLWDSNAMKGTPSKGLMQTIDGTFNAYKGNGMNDIWNPVHNAVAAINYMKSRYGSVNNVPGIKGMASGTGYVGYEKGTMGARQGVAMVGEKGPELTWMNKGQGVLDNVNTMALLSVPQVLKNLTSTIKSFVQTTITQPTLPVSLASGGSYKDSTLQNLTNAINNMSKGNNSATQSPSNLQNVTQSGFTFAENVNVYNNTDIKKFAEQFEFYRVAWAKGKGGS